MPHTYQLNHLHTISPSITITHIHFAQLTHALPHILVLTAAMAHRSCSTQDGSNSPVFDRSSFEASSLVAQKGSSTEDPSVSFLLQTYIWAALCHTQPKFIPFIIVINTTNTFITSFAFINQKPIPSVCHKTVPIISRAFIYILNIYLCNVPLTLY